MTRVTVLYFAALREQKGRQTEALEIADGTTVSELYAELFPPPAVPVAYARNQVSANRDEVVEDGDEVAFLPPLGGG